MSLPRDLLEQAEHLAKREKARPRQASLRRSVSSAYYALFHLLSSDATRLIGPNLESAAAYRVQRWFDHAEMKKVCGMFSTPTAHKSLIQILGQPVSDDLQFVAKAFIRLQEARHEADYDLSTVWTRVAAQQFVRIAQDAFDCWNRVKRSHEANVFAVAMLSSKLFDRER